MSEEYLIDTKKDFSGLLWSIRQSHTDVEIRSLSGDIAWAHRALLGAFSPFLHNILSDPAVNSTEKIVILLDDEIHFQSMLSILRLLYSGRIKEPLKQCDFESLLETISLLQLQILSLEKVPVVRFPIPSDPSPLKSSSASSQGVNSSIPDRYQCPLCPNKYEGLSGVRLHLAVHFKRQILKRISFGPNRVVHCSICSLTTKSPLWHFGVKHHYIKDYLEPSLYRKFFSSHRYFNKAAVADWSGNNGGGGELQPIRLPRPMPRYLQLPPPAPPAHQSRPSLPSAPLPKDKEPSYYEKLHFKCPLCSETYRGLFNVRRHLISHRRDEIAGKIAALSPEANSSSRCVLCSKTISESIVVHYAVEHGFAKEFFASSVVNYYFSSNKSLPTSSSATTTEVAEERLLSSEAAQDPLSLEDTSPYVDPHDMF